MMGRKKGKLAAVVLAALTALALTGATAEDVLASITFLRIG